jgi:hypothetical protein
MSAVGNKKEGNLSFIPSSKKQNKIMNKHLQKKAGLTDFLLTYDAFNFFAFVMTTLFANMVC